jgi:transcriptional regulator with XRE-family HTH domain
VNNYAPTTFAQQVTARLRGLIARYDLNQVDLAELCDVSQSQFSKIIRGVRPMSLDQFAALCDALDVDYLELLEEVREYISARVIQASPVVFVDDEERLDEPTVYDTGRIPLDGYASLALRRRQERLGVGGLIEDEFTAEDFDVSDKPRNAHMLAADQGVRKADQQEAADERDEDPDSARD